MALTQISTQGIKDGTITGTDLATNIDLVDNQKLRFGAGDDLQIFHDGSNSIIFEQGTGNLAIQSTGAEIQLSKGGSFEHMVRAIVDGAVMLYHDNSVKFETTSTGINVTNNITNTSGSDLVINSTGRVQLQVANGEKAVYCDNNGAVELYFNNSKKFETTSTGVDVSGELIIDGIVGDLKLNSSGAEIDFNRAGPCNLIMSGSGTFNILGGTPGSADTMASFITNGAVELYHDNSKKFETTSTGATVTGHLNLGNELNMTEGIAATRSIDAFVGDAGTFRIRGTNSGDSSGHQVLAEFRRNAGVHLNHSGSTKFETTSGGALITGNTSTTGAFVSTQTGGGVLSDNLSLVDNKKVKLGTSDDLQIYHESSSNDNVIDCATTRPLRIRMGGNNQFEFLSGGGIKMNDNKKIFLGDSSDLQIFHSGANSHINHTGTGRLLIDSSGDTSFRNTAGDENRAIFKNNGAVELYYDNSKKFETTSSGVNIPGNTFVNCTSDPLSQNAKFAVQHGGDGQSVAVFDFNQNFSRPNMFIKHARAGAVSGTRVAKMIVFQNLSGTEVGTIQSGLAGTSFNTSSDYRLKENITNISDGITRIKQLIPKKFNFIGDGDKTLKDGFLAHEVSSVVPEAITGTKDEVDENNQPVYQGIDQSKLVPLLVAAVQEAIGKIEVLETEVASLKAS